MRGSRSGVFGGQDLSVLVPCFNEESTVATILRRIRDALPSAEIIVVDDGSTDKSHEIVSELCEPLDLQLECLSRNSGKGSAVRSGLALATRPWVVIQDADLEYDPTDLRSLLSSAREWHEGSHSDVACYGSRYLTSGKAPDGNLAAYFATRFIGFTQWLLFGRWLTDPLTCYKLLPTDLMRRLRLESHGFELCAEMNAKLFSLAVPIQEAPIGYQPRNFAEGKKIGAYDFFRLLKALIRVWVSTAQRRVMGESKNGLK